MKYGAATNYNLSKKALFIFEKTFEVKVKVQFKIKVHFKTIVKL